MFMCSYIASYIYINRGEDKQQFIVKLCVFRSLLQKSIRKLLLLQMAITVPVYHIY